MEYKLVYEVIVEETSIIFLNNEDALKYLKENKFPIGLINLKKVYNKYVPKTTEETAEVV